MKNNTVQSVKNSLKFKAEEKDSILTVRVGVKKYSLPVKARMLAGGSYLFLSFPASSELYKIEMGDLVALAKDADPEDAYGSLNPGRQRRGRRSAGAELPAELAAAIKGLPSGYKLGYSADGSPKLVKTRKRTRK